MQQNQNKKSLHTFLPCMVFHIRIKKTNNTQLYPELFVIQCRRGKRGVVKESRSGSSRTKTTSSYPSPNAELAYTRSRVNSARSAASTSAPSSSRRRASLTHSSRRTSTPSSTAATIPMSSRTATAGSSRAAHGSKSAS